MTSKADGPEVGKRHEGGIFSPEYLLTEWDQHDAGAGKEHKSWPVRRTRVYVESLRDAVAARNALRSKLESNELDRRVDGQARREVMDARIVAVGVFLGPLIYHGLFRDKWVDGVGIGLVSVVLVGLCHLLGVFGLVK